MPLSERLSTSEDSIVWLILPTLLGEHVKGPQDVLEIGSVYEFVVLALDREKNRVSLGYKQLQPQPWQLAEEKFPVGTVVKGKVARIMPFGAFIELDKNIDGLLHVSNVSWEWLDDINKALKVGDEIEVEVLEFDGKTSVLRFRENLYLKTREFGRKSRRRIIIS